MEKTKTFRDLNVWKAAHKFVLGVYNYTEKFPKTEMYGLTSQFRRAAPVRSFLSTGQAVSIPANIYPVKSL